MNEKQLAHFRKMLLAWKGEMSQDIDTTLHSMQDEETVFADPNDRATQESDMALELRNRDRERKLIKKIKRPSPRLIPAIMDTANPAAWKLALSACRHGRLPSVHRLQDAGGNSRETDGQVIARRFAPNASARFRLG